MKICIWRLLFEGKFIKIENMKIDVRLDAFEGPLDLLLHLIEKNKINIYDIPIVEITNQYMEYISRMEKEMSMDSIDRKSVV